MSVPKRKDWYGTNPKEIIQQSHSAFGFKVSQFILPIDSTLVLVSSETVPRQNSPNRTLYVRGRGKVENDGVLLDDRVPGTYSGERPDHPKGITKVTAVEELEFWCFNWHENRGKFPNIEPLRLKNISNYTIPKDKRVLVCYGKLDDYTSGTYFISAGEPLTVAGDTYGFIFN